MSAAFVADASVGFAWVHPFQASERTDDLLKTLEGGSVAMVPTLWPIEIANVILVAVRRRKMTHAQAQATLEALKQISFSVDLEAPALALTTISDLANEHGLSAYDACYLELAIRKELPLATRDEALAKVARKCGIEVL